MRMQANGHVSIKDSTSNPAPLGLLGFGMTTVLLNLHNSGLYSLNAMVLAMGICYGGIAQIIAGIMEWKKGNTFGSTAFTSYGLYWLSLAGLLILPKLGMANPPESIATAAYFAIWGLFTLVMFVGTFKINWKLQLVFGSLTVLFVLLAVRDILGATGAGLTVGKVAGFEGILCGLSAVYAGLSQVLAELFRPKEEKQTNID
jgi:succinate-acetate transporter protein